MKVGIRVSYIGIMEMIVGVRTSLSCTMKMKVRVRVSYIGIMEMKVRVTACLSVTMKMKASVITRGNGTVRIKE